MLGVVSAYVYVEDTSTIYVVRDTIVSSRFVLSEKGSDLSFRLCLSPFFLSLCVFVLLFCFLHFYSASVSSLHFSSRVRLHVMAVGSLKDK